MPLKTLSNVIKFIKLRRKKVNLNYKRFFIIFLSELANKDVNKALLIRYISREYFT
jgi:hypothetical protein